MELEANGGGAAATAKTRHDLLKGEASPEDRSAEPLTTGR